MTVRRLVLHEIVALLSAEPDVEALPESRVEELAEAACAKYKWRPSFRQAERLCLAAAAEIRRRRRNEVER
jgi:hypothetical protein